MGVTETRREASGTSSPTIPRLNQSFLLLDLLSFDWDPNS